MKTLSIDIETYSDVPLPKTGVYRYCESPDFEILLFGYSVDSGPVQLVDLACGEQIPKEIIAALEDKIIIKWAFNASFERICLSRFLDYPTGEYLDPESWRCSMIWAATMGLPLSPGTSVPCWDWRSRSSQKARTSSNISASPALLQNPMVAGREIALFMRQRNGKPSSAITSVMWKPKWASSISFANFLYLNRSGRSITLTRKSMIVVFVWIWSLYSRPSQWMLAPVKS